MSEPTKFSSYQSLEVNKYLIASKILSLFFFVYLFILSITLLGASFKLFGAEFAIAIFQTTSNPIVGLMIGILSTAIIQSSSTTTTIIVGLVATGSASGMGLSLEAAIPMVMGANIGTSVTNTIVAMGHISRGDEFKRAFAGSMLHDFFNVCAVIVIMPLQMAFDIIGQSAHFLNKLFVGFGGLKFSSPLKMATKPVAKWILHSTGDLAWVGVIISLLLLIVALRYIVKVLRSMVISRVEKFFQRYIFRTPVLSFILGIGLTVMVQSSSITTSMVVPLLGAGVITIIQIYPYLLGANIGTTITAFLASFVIGSPEAVTVAFAHLMFNLCGIAIFWPLKRIPIYLATTLSNMTQKSKLVPILYIIIVFFTIPGLLIYLLG
ncbi:MAG: Na/Pi symporter [candidate division Zixibacteria bacterium]|nr:Na/Pi symporter [candidate division Zixibacteria bacterium]